MNNPLLRSDKISPEFVCEVKLGERGVLIRDSSGIERPDAPRKRTFGNREF